MARSISDEELQLRKRARRRLIGAIVLVAVAAVVLPMVLDSEPRQVSQEVSIKIPSPDSGTFTSRIVPLAPPAASKPGPDVPATAVKPQAATAAKSKTQQAPEPPAAVSPAPVKEAGTPEAKTEAPKTAKDSAKIADQGKGQFVVQVVALSDAARAKQIQQQISTAGIKSYTEIVKTAKGDVTRVRAGPFATRAAAEKARDQLKAMGLNGNVAAK
ncbi:MAG: SPOR domain-containing protein [Pseudomonadota bacterium]